MAAKKKTVTDLSERLRGDRQRDASVSASTPSDPLRPTHMVVTLDDLVPYDKNPRRKRNPLYDDIKASIRARGLDDPPDITRRPDGGEDAPYMMRRGGNTRLAILRELYEETGDRRFFSIKCMFHPWVDEIDALVGHLIENDLRGGMILRDRGYAARDWMAMMPEEQTKSLRKTADVMSSQGWKIDHSSLGMLLYAVKELDPFIPSTLEEGAGRPLVKELRTLQRKYEEYWESIETLGAPPTETLKQIWEDALKAHDDPRFNMGSFREEMEHNIADAFDLDASVVQTEIYLMVNGGKPSGVRPPRVDFSEPATMHPVPAAAKQVVAPPPPKTESITGNEEQGSTTASITYEPSQSTGSHESRAPAASVFDEYGEHGEASHDSYDADTAHSVQNTTATTHSETATNAQGALDGLDQMQAPVHENGARPTTLAVPEIQQACFDVARRMMNLVQMPESVISAQQIKEPSGFGFHLFLPDGMTNDLQRLTLVHLFYCFSNYAVPLMFNHEDLMRAIGLAQMQEFWSIDMDLMKLRQHPSIATGSPTTEHQLVGLFEEFDVLISQLRHRTHDHLATLWNLEGAHG